MISLQKHYGALIRHLHTSTNQTVSTALDEWGLTAAQGHILGYLASRQDPPCPRDIEVVFHLSHPTVSGLLARLEKKGFVELRSDPQDRRCKRIYTLPKGQELHLRMRQTIDDTEARLVAGFSREEQAQFMDFLERAIENVSPSKHHFKEETTE